MKRSYVNKGLTHTGTFRFQQPRMTTSNNRGRPSKDFPFLKETATLVGSGVPLRKALRRVGIALPEREIKNLYRLKRFKEFRDATRVKFFP